MININRGFDMDQLFAASTSTSMAREQATSMKLQRVLEPVTWHTFNTSSVQESYADLVLLRFLAANGRTQALDEYWKAQLLPKGELVKCLQTGKVFIVLNPRESAALAWPAKEAGPNLFAFETDLQELMWVCVEDIANYHILKSRISSPLHLFLMSQGQFSCPVALAMQVQAEVDLIAFHASRGSTLSQAV